jgi:hypothetical protein
LNTDCSLCAEPRLTSIALAFAALSPARADTLSGNIVTEARELRAGVLQRTRSEYLAACSVRSRIRTRTSSFDVFLSQSNVYLASVQGLQPRAAFVGAGGTIVTCTTGLDVEFSLCVVGRKDVSCILFSARAIILNDSNYHLRCFHYTTSKYIQVKDVLSRR